MSIRWGSAACSGPYAHEQLPERATSLDIGNPLCESSSEDLDARTSNRVEAGPISEYHNKQVRIWCTVFLSTCSVVAGPQAASEPKPIAGIFGRVLNAETHEAVRRAAIKIYTAKDQ